MLLTERYKGEQQNANNWINNKASPPSLFNPYPRIRGGQGSAAARPCPGTSCTWWSPSRHSWSTCSSPPCRPRTRPRCRSRCRSGRSLAKAYGEEKGRGARVKKKKSNLTTSRNDTVRTTRSACRGSGSANARGTGTKGPAARQTRWPRDPSRHSHRHGGVETGGPPHPPPPSPSTAPPRWIANERKYSRIETAHTHDGEGRRRCPP